MREMKAYGFTTCLDRSSTEYQASYAKLLKVVQIVLKYCPLPCKRPCSTPVSIHRVLLWSVSVQQQELRVSTNVYITNVYCHFSLTLCLLRQLSQVCLGFYVCQP
jgi:hypothetical protein